MADLTESSIWEDGIYQLEEIDPVIGGEGGVSNLQPQQLANRTLYLKDTLEGAQAALELVDEDLQEQIDELVAVGLRFKQVITLGGVQTLTTEHSGSFIRGVKSFPGLVPPEFTLPTCDSVGDGVVMGFTNAIPTLLVSSDFMTIICGGADIFYIEEEEITEIELRKTEILLLVANATLNRWEIISWQKRGGQVPPGTIIMFASDESPAGYHDCDGDAVLKATFADLYAVIGDTFNTGGEDPDEFRLPDITTGIDDVFYYIKF